MREFLKGLDLDTETINTIMAEYGKNFTELKEERDKLKDENKSLKSLATSTISLIIVSCIHFIESFAPFLNSL